MKNGFGYYPGQVLPRPKPLGAGPTDIPPGFPDWSHMATSVTSGADPLKTQCVDHGGYYSRNCALPFMSSPMVQQTDMSCETRCELPRGDSRYHSPGNYWDPPLNSLTGCDGMGWDIIPDNWSEAMWGKEGAQAMEAAKSAGEIVVKQEAEAFKQSVQDAARQEVRKQAAQALPEVKQAAQEQVRTSIGGILGLAVIGVGLFFLVRR